MKKNLFYFAAFLALASCAKNEVTELGETPMNSDVIGFNASTNMTRGADNGLTQVQGGFNVIGLKSDETPLFDKDADPTISSEYKFTDKWGWALKTDDKKWPTGDVYPLQFIAAYPKIDIDVLGPWVTPAATYEQDIATGATIADNVDLLAANITEKSKPVSGVAKLNFKHILSNIKFQIITPENYKVYLQQITIKGVAKEGRKYNYKESTYSAEPTPYTSAQLGDFAHLLGNAAAGVFEVTGAVASAPVAVTNFYSDAAAGQTWKMMPQTTTAAWDKATFVTTAGNYPTAQGQTWEEFLLANPTILDGAMIELVYRMEDNTGKSVVGWKSGETKQDGLTTAATDCFVQVAYPLNLSAQANKNQDAEKGWLPGYQYTYQIKLGTPDATNGTVTKPDFTDPDGGDTDIPVDNPAVNPGEDITKDGYIEFEVAVDEWVENTETEIK